MATTSQSLPDDPTTMRNGHTNGAGTNGVSKTSIKSENSLPPLEEHMDALTVVSRPIAPREPFVRITKVTRKVNDLICRFDDYDEPFVKKMSLRSYLQFISDERLRHMPRRGSDWDRVLSTAQFFGLQIWEFASKVDVFATECLDSASAALAGCQVLLEIGHDQARALVPTFTALYELAMMLSNIGQIRDLERMPRHIREGAVDIFCDLVDLAGSIASHYRQRISGLQPGTSVKISFDAAFGQQIDQVWRSKNSFCDSVWAFKLNRNARLRWLREKLQPSFGPSVRNALYDEVLEQLDRSEDTCNWIKDSLVQFFDSNDQILNVSAPAGFGKTVLAEWVQERLARPLDSRSYAVLAYNFPYDSANEATTIACVKSLLFQLLERSVGNVALYGELIHVFDQDAKKHDSQKLQSSLWKILHHGLQAAENAETSFVILTDGCDDTCGSAETSLHFIKKLQECVGKLSHTRAINFSRPASHLSDKCKHLALTKKHVNEDIKTHLRQTLSQSVYWRALSFSAQEEIVDGLAKKANGSFLWAFYAGRLLTQERTHEGFSKAIRSVPSELPKILNHFVEKLNLKKNEMLQHLLSFMLVTSEPFAVHEIAELLSTDLHKHALAATAFNISRFISEHCGDLVVVRGGRLHFRSAVVRLHMQSLLGKSLLSARDAHLQLTLRMLLYARLSLHSDQDVLVDELEDVIVDEVLDSHQFLGYVMRNWIIHFRSSGLIDSHGRVQLGDGFREIFPESVLFVLLERSCWRRHHIGLENAQLHELALKIRESCFGKEHVTVLQTLINLGHVHVKISDSPIHGAGYFYRAVKLGQVVLSRTSSIVAACTTLFLSWTEKITVTVTTRTEIITYREEMIKFMIEICKHRHGRSSDEVIFWYEELAKFYLAIHEEWQVTIVYRELYEIIVLRYGKSSPKARKIGEFFGSLDIVLKGKETAPPIKELEELIFETSDEMEITDHTCIALLLKLAHSYHVCGKYYLAERLYVSLWRRICVIFRANASLEVHIAKIRIALEYVNFLRELERLEEATSILICLWNEYEHYECEMESLIIWIRKIGTVCRSFGLLSITITILKKVWGWFKGHGKHDDEEAQQTTIILSEVVEEITETTVTEKTTTITETEVTETVVKEIYEHHFTRCKKTRADKGLFSSCMALIALYIKRGNWGEAKVIITRTLEISWKAILSADVEITVSEHWVKECILVARRLAYCHRHQGDFELAEKIYLRIYYACLASLDLEDEYLQESILVLIEFYEQHHRHQKVIEIYIEVLEKYRKHLDHTHRLIIKTLYLLAAHCELIGHRDTYVYYLEIVTVLNKGHKHCHHDALKAALWLFRHYHSRQKWVEFRDICVVLWETIVHHHHECEITEEIIVEIYQKYTYVLEVHFKVEFNVLYDICVKYKETITVICGKDSAALILALIALAELCEKHEEHYHESVTIYEEVIRKITTTKTTTKTITEKTIHTVKKRLSRLYVTIITTGKGGEKKTVPLDRAIEICTETYVRLKIELGCWHKSTLQVLLDIVVLYKKVATKEAHLRIIQLLEISVTEIISTLTVTINLFSAAVTLASIYVTAGLVKEGHELLRQLRHLIIFHGKVPGQEITLRLNVEVTKVAFVFLIAFEYGLYGDTRVVSYTEIMADIIFESLLYEEYSRVIEGEETLEIILECGSKLRAFWDEHKRDHLLVILDARLFQLFKKQYGASFKGTSDEHIRIFYLALLVELSKDRSTTKVDFASLALKAGNDKVKALLTEGDFHSAQRVSHCLFHWANHQKLYHRHSCIQYGYKLAEFLAGIDINHPTNAKQADIRRAMLETSREIMTEVLEAFRAANIDIVALRFEDVAGLIRLLGAQANFIELEALLLRLWQCREVVRTARGWSPDVVLDIGKLLVHAQWAHGHIAKAIDTAELLSYNLRRGRGRLDAETLEVSRLLASLYASAGRPANAMTVHESVLREISSACHRYGDGDAFPDRTRLTAEARLHLELLKAAHYQMQGWTKSAHETSELYSRLKTGLKLEVPEFNHWVNNRGDKTALDGKYIPLRDWKLQGEVKDCVLWKRNGAGVSTPGPDVILAARGWWLVK